MNWFHWFDWFRHLRVGTPDCNKLDNLTVIVQREQEFCKSSIPIFETESYNKNNNKIWPKKPTTYCLNYC